MPISSNRRKLTVSLSLIFALSIAACLVANALLPRVSASIFEGRIQKGSKAKERLLAERARKLRRQPPAEKQSPQRSTASSEQEALMRGPQKRIGEQAGEISFDLLDEQLGEGYDKPREAAEFFHRKRLSADEKEIPIEKYFEAQERMRSMQQFSTSLNRYLTGAESNALRANPESAIGAAAGWTELGPGNIGGRTRAILINPQDPNVMYAAGVSGGVWKSTDAGQSWMPISDLVGNLTVSSMAMEPGNPNVIYVGTGEGVYGLEDGALFATDFRGAGILKTTDGGLTWNILDGTKTSDFYYVNDIAVSTGDKNRIYAATKSGVMRSLDGGATWTRVLNPIGPRGGTVNAGCLDLALRTDKTTDYIFAACGNSEQGTVYRNTDAGGAGSWDAVLTDSDMGRIALAIAPSNQEIVYAVGASIERNQFFDSLYAVFRTTDGGAAGSWNAQVRNTSANKINRSLLSILPLAVATDCGFDLEDGYLGQGFYDLTIAVDPVDPQSVWVGGIELFRSDDAGVNWGLAGGGYDFNTLTNLGPIHPDQHVIVFHPNFDGAANQTVYIGNDGGLFRTDNARAAIVTNTAEACNPNLVSVKWANLNSNYGVTQFYNGTFSADGKTYIGGTQDNGTLLGTDNNGVNSWKIINGGDGGFVAIDQINASVMFATFPGISFRKSTDGGNTFGSAISGISDGGEYFVSPLAMDESDSQRLWTGGYYIWRTANGAARWERASSLTAGGESVSAIAIAPTDSNRMLVGMGDGYILRNDAALTSNSSTSWPAVQVRSGWVSSIAFDPNNKDIAYATFSTFGGAHVYRTVDGGVNWTIADGSSGSNRIPDIPVHSLAIDPSNTARLYVGTDVGVFVSNDGGANWAVEAMGFANAITETVKIHVAAGVTSIYAFTHGRGAWRTMINNSGCNFTLSPSTRNVESAASTGSINVKASPNGCKWGSASNASWLTVNGSGEADGTVNFDVEANSTFNTRTATATIAGRTFTIIQSGQTDVDAPTVAITEPSISQPANISGLVNLAGTASDNNAVSSVGWQSDRGSSGTASYSATTGIWTVSNVPLSPGDNVITVTARDTAGNLGRTSISLAAMPPSALITVVGNGVFGTAGDGDQAAAAQMSRPWQIAFDGSGNLYVTDTDNHTVRKVAPDGIITTIAGTPGLSGFSGDGGLAIEARLNAPIGVAVDGSGNVYISEAGNNRIRKVTAADGKISTIAGTGSGSYGGDGGPAVAASLNFPYGLTLDKDGNLFVCDFSNHRVRKINAADGMISTVAGTGSAGFNGDGQPGRQAALASPINVAFDADGNMIIADSGNNRIRKVNASDGQINTIVGTGSSGFSGDGGPANQARIVSPAGVIFDGEGNLYFADRGNSRVRKVAAGTEIITTIAGVGLPGFNGDGLAALASRLNVPNTIAIDQAGNVYIGDRENLRVRRIVYASAMDTIPPTIAINQPISIPDNPGQNGFTGLTGTATDNVGVFLVRWSNDRGGSGVAAGTSNWSISNIPLQNGPNNLTVTAWDANGNASSAKALINFNPSQIITTLAGNGLTGDSGDGGSAIGARLFAPTGIAADAMGNLYIADSENHRVRKVTPAGLILPFAGNGKLGSSGDGGPAIAATMNRPQGVTVDSSGNVYISDTGNQRIRKVDTNGVITTVAGNGQGGFSGDGGQATEASLNLPFQVAVDSTGNLYIADGFNRRVRKVTANTGIISTFAGDGRIGNSGNGGPATQAQFLLPYGVAVENSGVVYILDAFDNRVRRVGTDGVISNYVGTGDFGYSGDGGPATDAEIDPLSFIRLDPSGNLYIADRFNHAIRKVTAATGIITTLVGNGVSGFSGDGSIPQNAQISSPFDVAFDQTGNMYVADTGNQRIRRVFTPATLKTVANVSAASFLGEVLSSELIAAGFGSNLATVTQIATTVPLPTALGDTTVKVRDAAGIERLAPLFFVSSGQVNFLVPGGTANGAATVTVTGGDGIASTGIIQIASVAPGLFSANSDGQGVAAAVVFRLRANGEQVYEPVSRFDTATGRYVAVPIDLGPEGDQVFLIPFGTGLRFRNSLMTASAMVGGETAELLFVGAQGGFIGLDQANIRLNRSLIGKGDVDVKLTLDGRTSNMVRINIK
ncbi:MAG: BACON domain-containing carbohydrate-binding protein [Blastocatellales bacterium]